MSDREQTLAMLAFIPLALSLGAEVDELDRLWLIVKDRDIPDSPIAIARDVEDAIDHLRAD